MDEERLIDQRDWDQVADISGLRLVAGASTNITIRNIRVGRVPLRWRLQALWRRLRGL